MSSGDGDFLDEIFMAEQKQYSDAYREGFELSASEVASAELPDRSNELHSAWVHGLQYGAQLGSELYSYQGLAEEVLATCAPTSPAERVGKQHPIHLANSLLHMLNESPGPLSRPCDQFAKHPTFDTDLSLIRNKAKQLISALGIHMVSRNMDSLDF